MATEKTITLKWSPVSAADLAGYKIYWGPVKGVYPLVLRTVGKSTTSIKLTMPADANYYYAVAAYDVAGNPGPKVAIKV